MDTDRFSTKRTKQSGYLEVTGGPSPSLPFFPAPNPPQRIHPDLGKIRRSVRVISAFRSSSVTWAQLSAQDIASMLSIWRFGWGFFKGQKENPGGGSQSNRLTEGWPRHMPLQGGREELLWPDIRPLLKHQSKETTVGGGVVCGGSGVGGLWAETSHEGRGIQRPYLESPSDASKMGQGSTIWGS